MTIAIQSLGQKEQNDKRQCSTHPKESPQYIHSCNRDNQMFCRSMLSSSCIQVGSYH